MYLPILENNHHLTLQKKDVYKILLPKFINNIMLQVTSESIIAIKKFVEKRWPEKRVSCQENPDAYHKNRFIMISTLVDEQIAHYEYSNGYLEFHLEGEYYGNVFNYNLYKHLREKIDTSNSYRWHNWWGMKQGRLTYEYYYIDNILDLAEALFKMIPYIDSIIYDYLKNNGFMSSENNNMTSEEIQSVENNHNNILLNKKEQLTSPDIMSVEELTPNVMYIKDLPFEHFEIPDYQRPYKWNPKHVNQLINDLITFRDKKEYRLGTLVLHDNKIVDGQQRIMTLSLLFFVLFENLINIMPKDTPYNDFLKKIQIYWQRSILKNPISIAHVRENLTCIRERKEDLDERMLSFLLERCQFVVVRLPKIAEAFQFFDSQNARGKDLEPHDLLKAFHLREINKLSEHDKHNITYWQDEKSDFLVHLFLAMYRVNRWSKSYSGDKFTKDDINVFKGISPNTKPYPFYKQQIICHYFINDYVEDKTRMVDRTNMEYPFQLDQVCINGSRFFDMIRYYGLRFKQIQKSDTYKSFGNHERSAYKVINFLNTYSNRNRKGDVYTRELFDCMLLYYIDRFGFEEIDKIVWKLFKEAYKLRLKNYSVKLATINNYAKDERMFKIIRDAQTPFDIINIPTCQLEQIAANVDKEKDELLQLFKL